MYSEKLQKVLREALLNNTYDKPSMDGAIKMTLENSYNYLYHLQNDYVGFEERHYTTGGLLSRKDPVKPGQLYVNKYGYASIDINFELISPQSYERYRRSEFYHNDIVFQDIIDHPEIFRFAPVLMIDGMVIDNWKLTLNGLDEYCTFTLPGKRKDFVMYNKRRFQMENPNYDETHEGELSLSDIDSEVYKEHRIDAFIFENEARTKSLQAGPGIFTLSTDDERNCFFTIKKKEILNLANKDADPDKGMFFMYVHIDTGSTNINMNPTDSFLLTPATKNNSSYDDWMYVVSPRLYAIVTAYPATKFTITPIYLKGCHLYQHKTRMEDISDLSDAQVLYDDASLAPDGFLDETNRGPLSRHAVKEIKTGAIIELIDYDILDDEGESILANFKLIFRPYHIVKENHTDFMVVERITDKPYAMPIPKYDMMVYRVKPYHENEGLTNYKTTSGNFEQINLDNSKTINEYYPNIYSFNVDDTTTTYGDRIWSYYFYHEAESLKYTPMHHWYYKFLTYKFTDKPLEQVISGIYNEDLEELSDMSEEELDALYDVFNEILNYKHFKHTFGEMDFLFNYRSIEENIEAMPIEYRIDTLKKWVRQEPYTLRDYVIEQNRISQTYYFFCNTINLEDRIRTSDRAEGHGTTDFTEDHYVFSFTNIRKLYPEVNNIRVFVDGLFIHDYHQIRFMNLDFIYIPCRHFTDDSYVEIELFPEYSFEQKVVFESMDDWKEIILVDPEFNIFPTLSDIYAYEKVDDIQNAEVEYFNYYDAPEGVIEDSNYPYRDFKEHAVNDSDTGTIYEVKDSLLQRWNPVWKEWTDGTEYMYQYDDSVFNFIGVYREGEYEISSVPTFNRVFDTYEEFQKFDKNTSLEDAVVLYDDFSLAPEGLLDDMGCGPFKKHAVKNEETSEIIEMDGYNILANEKQDPGISVIGYEENAYYYCKETDKIYYYWHGEMFIIGVYSNLKPVEFTRLRHFKIAPKYEELIGKELYIRFSKRPTGFPIKIEKDGYPQMTIKTKNFKFQPNYIRIFKNGRFLSRKRYAFFGHQNEAAHYPVIQILEKCYAGDDIYIDITPFNYKEIYSQEELKPKEDLVNLAGYITKPYDARYYECYLNGRRMSLNNVMTIDPWSITFVNLKSIYSLEIFEKERDWEYFGLDYKENVYAFSPSDLIKQPFVTEEDKNHFIQEIINEVKHPDLIIHPNTNEEEKHPIDDLTVYVQMNYFYWDELLQKRFVNPDTVQFSQELIKNEYATIYNTYHVVPFDESGIDRKAYYPGVMLLSPDKQIRALDDHEHMSYYCVGHPDDKNAKEYINDDISEYSGTDKFGTLDENMRIIDGEVKYD